MSLKYRSDIDGLRSLAILPVVAYHAGFEFLSGGFTGVDVFFVISGYLITSILITEMRDKSFSVLEFYKRRFLRILPALAVMILATVIASYCWLLPNEFAEMGRSAAAAALFVSNIMFWMTSGYFEGPADLKPLLHTWSLAVEEQFYIFFPFMLIIISRWLKGRFATWILVMIAISFVGSIIGLAIEPSATFYLLPTRVWELGIGALLATGVVARPSAPWAREALGGAGIVAIALGVFLLSSSSPFPGYNALYPCVGAALLIHCGQGTFAGRVLSTGPLVFFGKISYSLYLWHWPVIVFIKLFYGSELSLELKLMAIAMSIALATASYHWIETPFRSREFRQMPPARVAMAGATGILLVALAGAAMSHFGPVGRQFPKDVLAIAAHSDYRALPDYEDQFRPGSCFIGSMHSGSEAFDARGCLAKDPNRKNYLVLGDSHAAHVWRAFGRVHPDINFMQATVSGCRPLIDAKGERRCTDIVSMIYKQFLPSAKIDGLILAGRWRGDEISDLVKTAGFARQYAPKVIVLGPIPEYEGVFPFILAQSRYYNDPEIVDRALDHRKKPLSDAIGRALAKSGAIYVPMYDLICPEGKCIRTVNGNVPMQFDYGHLTLDGAVSVVESMESYWPRETR